MKLGDLAEYLERVTDTRSRIEKQDIVWEALQEVGSSPTQQDVILALATCQRFEDNGVSKKTVRKAAGEVVDGGEDIIREYESEYGDLPTAVHEAAQRTERIVPKKDINLLDLWDELATIEEASGTELERHITTLLSERSPEKWLTHAVLGDDGMSLGFGVKSAAKMLRRHHDSISKEDMARARALCPDILELNRLAPQVPTEPRVGQPFKPMLASSEDLPEIPEMDELETSEIPTSERGKWLIQPKFDGARILVHYDGPADEIRAFSRNCNEVTDSLPELQALAEDLDDDARFILDGEAVAYEDGEPQDFQHIMTRFNRKHDVDQQDIDVRFHFFDAVYAEGDRFRADPDRTRTNHQSRINVLETIFGTLSWFHEDKNQIDDEELDARDTRVAETQRVYSTDNMMENYQRFVDEGYEGAIVKRDDAEYQFDKRSHDWRKVKHSKENVDLRIAEVIEGEDSRAGKMGALRLETQEGYDLGKVGTGFTEADEEYFWENRESLLGSIIEVEWQELVEEDGEYSLRFPVYVAERDKDEADSIEKIESL